MTLVHVPNWLDMNEVEYFVDRKITPSAAASAIQRSKACVKVERSG